MALQYIGLGLAARESGLWAVAAGRGSAVLVLLPVLLLIRHPHEQLARADTSKALVIGAGAALGLSLYLLATHQQLMAIAVALASLYPVVPVLLGVFVLRERVSRGQFTGLTAAAVAVVLLSTAQSASLWSTGSLRDRPAWAGSWPVIARSVPAPTLPPPAGCVAQHQVGATRRQRQKRESGSQGRRHATDSDATAVVQLLFEVKGRFGSVRSCWSGGVDEPRAMRRYQ